MLVIVGGLDSQVGSVVGQSAKRPGFDGFPAAQKCWAQMQFVNIYQFRFHPMLKYGCVYQGRPVNVKHDARCVMGKVGGKTKDPNRGRF